MIGKNACPAPDAGWIPGFACDKRDAFARRSCLSKEIGWDDDLKKSDPALGDDARCQRLSGPSRAAICSTNSTILRRSFGSAMRVKARVKARPSVVARK